MADATPDATHNLLTAELRQPLKNLQEKKFLGA